MALIWINVIHPPRRHPMIRQAEIDHLVEGGALVDIDEKPAAKANGPSWSAVKQLLSNRMLLGVYVAQYSAEPILSEDGSRPRHLAVRLR